MSTDLEPLIGAAAAAVIEPYFADGEVPARLPLCGVTGMELPGCDHCRTKDPSRTDVVFERYLGAVHTVPLDELGFDERRGFISGRKVA